MIVCGSELGTTGKYADTNLLSSTIGGCRPEAVDRLAKGPFF